MTPESYPKTPVIAIDLMGGDDDPLSRLRAVKKFISGQSNVHVLVFVNQTYVNENHHHFNNLPKSIKVKYADDSISMDEFGERGLPWASVLLSYTGFLLLGNMIRNVLGYLDYRIVKVGSPYSLSFFPSANISTTTWSWKKNRISRFTSMIRGFGKLCFG